MGITEKLLFESFYQYFDRLKLEITPDSNRWETFYQHWEGYAQIVKSDNRKLYFSFEPDTIENTLKFTPNRDTIPFILDFERLDSSRYHIFGKFEQDSLNMIFRKEDINERALVKRGFHWINEFPYNR